MPVPSPEKGGGLDEGLAAHLRKNSTCYRNTDAESYNQLSPGRGWKNPRKGQSLKEKLCLWPMSLGGMTGLSQVSHSFIQSKIKISEMVREQDCSDVSLI